MSMAIAVSVSIDLVGAPSSLSSSADKCRTSWSVSQLSCSPKSVRSVLRCGRRAASASVRERAPVTVLAAVETHVSNRPSSDVLEVWRSADAVCFDVDSTVCEDEGIDELAAFCGAGDAVAAWTARAMGGAVPFEIALASRLELFKPSLSTLTRFLASKPPRLTPGIADLIGKLHRRGTDVYLVSGGFRQMIEPAALLLQIPKERIYANQLLFNISGEFSGFDPKEPTCRSGGKAVVIEKIKQEHGYKKLVMVGDGATDLEVSTVVSFDDYRIEGRGLVCELIYTAKRPGGADIFVCFGGVASRPTVAASADWYVLNFEDLTLSA